MERNRSGLRPKPSHGLGLLLCLILFGVVVYYVRLAKDDRLSGRPAATMPKGSLDTEEVVAPENRDVPSDPAPTAPEAPSWGSETAPPWFRVKVLNRDSLPEADAQVTVTHVRSLTSPQEDSPSSRVERRTDSQGMTLFAALPLGVFSVRARKEDRAAESLAVLSTPQEYGTCTLVLAPVAGMAGRVLEDGGKPIVGARVATYKKNFRECPPVETTTRYDGSFSFAGLPPGYYQLMAEATGWAVGFSGVVQPGAQDVTIRLRIGGRISGQVRMITNGQPATNFAVEARGLGTELKAALSRSDDSGRFAFEGLARDTYIVYGRDETRVIVGPDSRVEVVPGKDTRGVDLLVEPGAVVYGRVYEEGSGAPVPGVRVAIMSPEGGHGTLDETDAEGRYRLAAVPSGHVEVIFQRAEDPLVRAVEVDIPPGTDEFPVDYAWLRGVTLRGTVVDAAGAPAPGAMVRVWTPALPGNGDYWTDSSTTDGEGRFVLTHCRTAPVASIQATDDRGRSPVSGPFAIPDGGLDGLTLKLNDAPTGSASGLVVDSRGKPVLARLRLHLLSEEVGSQVRKNAFTEADGYFYIDGLSAGDYGVQLGSAGKPGLAMGTPQDGGTVTLRPGQSLRNLRFVLDTQGAISGTVCDPEGTPVRGADVGAYAEGDVGAGQTARTDSFGRFEVQCVLAGAHTVVASKNGYQQARQTGIQPGETVDLVLEPETANY